MKVEISFFDLQCMSFSTFRSIPKNKNRQNIQSCKRSLEIGHIESIESKYRFV